MKGIGSSLVFKASVKVLTRSLAPCSEPHGRAARAISLPHMKILPFASETIVYALLSFREHSTVRVVWSLDRTHWLHDVQRAEWS
jgi:hypothetical protein